VHEVFLSVQLGKLISVVFQATFQILANFYSLQNVFCL
jgi:hypothetical protein